MKEQPVRVKLALSQLIKNESEYSVTYLWESYKTIPCNVSH